LLQSCAEVPCRALVESSPFLLKSNGNRAPYVYEASCSLANGNNKYPGYYLSLSFDGHQVGKITALEIKSGDGAFQYMSINNGKFEQGFAISPPEGLHEDFHLNNGILADQFLQSRLFLFKLNSIFIVRLYTDNKFDSNSGRLIIEHNTDCP